MPIKSRWDVDVPRCSIQQWIFDSATGPLPDSKAFVDPERPDTHFLTRSDYRLLAKRVALGLQASGLEPGDRVLLFSSNNLYFPAVFLGVIMAGGVFTGANPAFTPRELAYQLRDSGARFLVVADFALDTAFEAVRDVGLPRDHIFVFSGDSPASELARHPAPAPGAQGRVDGARHWTELVAGNLAAAEGWSWTEPADPAATACALNYSSGTTGRPKGVEISHHSYVANGVGVVFVNDLDPENITRRPGSAALCFLPLYHAMAQTYFQANFPKVGTPVYMMEHFDFAKMLEYVQKYRISTLTVVPPIAVALSKHPLVREYDLSSIRTVGCGAAPLSQEVLTEVERLWPSGDVHVVQGWGMTEVTCTCLGWDPLVGRGLGGVGELMPNCAARLVALDGKTEITEAGVPGELWVTGPTMMRRYWANEAATRDTTVVDADGTRWLRTGDVATVTRYAPGGIFHIVDRIKELIKVKGNQVAPAELEGLLLERPDVTDCAVVGVTIKGEELPRAYIVLNSDSNATGKDIAEWLAKRVVRYKQLRGGVVFTDEIPKTPSGKILRRQLRDLAAKEVGDRKPTASKLS